VAKIEVGRFSELFKRFLSIAGVETVLPELSPEMSTVFVVESERPEWEFLKAQRLIGATTSIGGLAGQMAISQFRNPAGSAVIMVVEKIWMTATTAKSYFNINIVATVADLAVVNPRPTTRDSRWPIQPSAIISSQTNVAATGQTIVSGGLDPVDRLVEIPCVAVITPGFALALITTTLASSHIGTAHWLERQLPPLEAA